MEYHVFLAVANGNTITRKLKQLTEDNKVTTNTVVDKRNSFKIGKVEMKALMEILFFKQKIKLGSVEIVIHRLGGINKIDYPQKKCDEQDRRIKRRSEKMIKKRC